MKPWESALDLVRVKKSYRSVFQTPEGRRVLRDLAKVCHAASTTFDADPREQARKEGKRQIWLRIQNMIMIPDDEVYKLEKEEDQ